MAKFKNKYRIESNRLRDWDYGSNAMYFVTICCKNRECFFGQINDGEINLSEIGEIADRFWLQLPQHFPFVVLHHHIIMPNHMHGIVEIFKLGDAGDVETPNLGVSTAGTDPTPSRTTNASKKWNPKTLGVIINQYKRVCTINARKLDPGFAWQPNYHDHIIRNEKSYSNISNYIIENPLKWQKDIFHPKNPNLVKNGNN